MGHAQQQGRQQPTGEAVAPIETAAIHHGDAGHRQTLG